MAVVTVANGQVEEADWQEIQRLLKAGEYEPAASLLHSTGVSIDGEVDEAFATILEATRQMCLAGTDYQAEVEFHKEAYYIASAREQQLREHLQVLLNIIAARTGVTHQRITVAATAQSSPGPIEHMRDVPSLLKRLQGLLGRGGETQPAARDIRDEERTGPSLAVYCLGPFAAYQNDVALTEWNGLKGLKILKYIVAQYGRPVAKDVLMESLWPDSDLEAARRNLHQAIYSLRQTLRSLEPDFQHISFHNDTYRFNPELNLWIDFIEFERYLQLGQQHETSGQIEEAMRAYGIAEELYQGDFLEDDPYEEWTAGQRERLRSLYLKIADRLASYYLQRREYMAATAISQKALAKDPYYEAAHRRLMECFMAQGQRHLAVRQYQTCARLLAEGLELEPSPETVQLYEQIKSTA